MSTSLAATGSALPSGVVGRPPVNSVASAVNADELDEPITSTTAMGAVGPPVATTISSGAVSHVSTLPDTTSNQPETSEPAPPTPATPLPSTTAPPLPSTIQPISSIDLPPASAAIPSTSISSAPAPGIFTIPVIVGIAVGGAALLAAIAGCCWFLGRSRRRRARRDMEDAALGGFKPPKQRRPSRGGYARQDGATPSHSQAHLPQLLPPRAGLSRAEARASVQLYGRSQGLPNPPRRGVFDDGATVRSSSAWTDNSEMDVFAVDGSSYARTLSTVSRPNSEYDLADDPSATYTHTGYETYGTHSGFASPFPTYQPAQRQLQTPSPAGYPPQFHSSPTGTFGPPTPIGSGAWREPSPHGMPVGSVVAPAPSQMALPGPSRRPDGRIPAPKLLVDTKAPFDANGVPLSSMPSSAPLSSMPLSSMPTPLSAMGTWSSGLPTPLDRAPSTMSPESTFFPPSRSTSRGAAFAPSPAVAGPSYQPRLVTRQASRSDDRPSALPYAGEERPGLKRGPTIIRHADGGAFDDAVPDDEGEVHLPPAYDEIYKPNP